MNTRTNNTCKKCGHKCHCDKVNCPDCVNDVCGFCDCEPDVNLETDARTWPFMDSGLEHYQ
jgi:hypothetical protein